MDYTPLLCNYEKPQLRCSGLNSPNYPKGRDKACVEALDCHNDKKILC